MDNYNNFTNAELEEEKERLTQDFELAQKASYENYVLMVELAKKYSELMDVVNKRNGKTSPSK